ncbi:hypothetical protein DDE19_06645 [Micromonospora ureilytica]|uniref:Uncharacterized protein n=1 Tax=Micromonospora ureilytica TaxID=709868 RepID=A0A3N9Y0R7_9ACTN|nr:hypothetical protein DDE19_06645 [Micromonospora ureilytica]
MAASPTGLSPADCGRIPAVRGFLPWLAVLAVVLLLSALRLRTLATVVSVGWLVWCVWTWFRPTRRGPRSG